MKTNIFKAILLIIFFSVIILAGTSCGPSKSGAIRIVNTYLNQTNLYIATFPNNVQLHVIAYDKYQAMKLVDEIKKTANITTDYELQMTVLDKWGYR